MKQTLPRPLGLLRDRELLVGIESYTSGKSLSTTSGRWRGSLTRKIDDLRLASQWLSEFHLQTEISRQPLGARQIASWIERPLSRYARVFPVTSSEESLFVAFVSGQMLCRTFRFPLSGSITTLVIGIFTALES